MKKLFYLLAAISLTAGADAKTITLSQAEDIAAGFIKGKAVNAPRLKKVPGNTTDKNVSLPYYIYVFSTGELGYQCFIAWCRVDYAYVAPVNCPCRSCNGNIIGSIIFFFNTAGEACCLNLRSLVSGCGYISGGFHLLHGYVIEEIAETCFTIEIVYFHF